MTKSLGQNVIIENVGGADGSVGAGRVARARLGGLKVDGELHFAHLLHREFGRAFALQNKTGINSGLAIGIGDIGSIADQAPEPQCLAALLIAKRRHVTMPIQRWVTQSHRRRRRINDRRMVRTSL
jgi:hypothetical protein